ncbi:M16 family metallopeptidase [Chthonobacter albigriseus]|uniref:M16 family metallopeptidase n=1 Tax=Chthonobacter albigriseus TaxID=1683161 RepID=UPI0015EFCFA2|nr:pitrilysin family protein [Chthonobacter albigriseus]
MSFFLRLPAVRRTLAAAVGLFVAVLPLQALATEVQEVVSPGGIRAWLVSDDTVPLIAMDFAFRGGTAQDPDGKPGVANLLSGLIDEGAGDLDSAEFQRRMEAIALRMGFDADRDAFQGSVATLAARRDEAFELVALAITRPRLDPEPIDRMRSQIAAGLRSQQTDPDWIASRLFMEKTFPDHPYGRPSDGTPESLAAITRDDLSAFHAATFAQDNLVVGVVGAISAEELAPLLDKTFGGLPKTSRLKPVADVAPVVGERITGTLPNPQTVIRFGAPGVKRMDPDFMAAYVMNHILGGGTFSSRLYNEIREKRGLAYSVWSGVVSYRHAGLFMAGTSTGAAQADQTVELMRAELQKMAAEGPTEKELADAKTYLTGNYALRFDASGKIAEQLVGLQLEGLPIDYFATRNQLVEAVTLEQVKAVAAKMLAGPLTVVTVGPPQG